MFVTRDEIGICPKFKILVHIQITCASLTFNVFECPTETILLDQTFCLTNQRTKHGLFIALNGSIIPGMELSIFHTKPTLFEEIIVDVSLSPLMEQLVMFGIIRVNFQWAKQADIFVVASKTR